jgi:hypothetical protein
VVAIDVGNTLQGANSYPESARIGPDSRLAEGSMSDDESVRISRGDLPRSEETPIVVAGV